MGFGFSDNEIYNVDFKVINSQQEKEVYLGYVEPFYVTNYSE